MKTAEKESINLQFFYVKPKQVLTRGQLLEKLWDVDEKFVGRHTLTTIVSCIRNKIEADGGTPYIKTIYSMGYQWTGGKAKRNTALSVKRLFLWICIGLLPSMTAITLSIIFFEWKIVDALPDGI